VTDRDREIERQRDRETERQRDRETERQRDRETERQRETQRREERVFKINGGVYRSERDMWFGQRVRECGFL
jgi:hypothetical protein